LVEKGCFGRAGGGGITPCLAWRNTKEKKKDRVHKFIWDMHKQFFSPPSRTLDNISEYVTQKIPLKKKDYLKTGFNSQTYKIIVISSESLGNIGPRMEGRASFVMGEGLHNTSSH
jgi:hypothetical protein